MITCPVCGKDNNDLLTTCTSCRSYLQAKVDALDLFATLWQLIENPQVAFKRISLAINKNYVVFLNSLFGIAAAYFLFWFFKAGDAVPNLFLLLLAGLVGGPFLGIAFAALTSLISVWLGRRLGGDGNVRNTFAVCAYSFVPIILSLVFVFPVEMGVFGLPFFGTNPPASVLKPNIYTILVSLNLVSILWTFILLARGLSVVNGIGRGKSWIIVGTLATGQGSVIWISSIL